MIYWLIQYGAFSASNTTWMQCSTWQKCGTDLQQLQYFTLAIDPMGSFKCMSPWHRQFHTLPGLLDNQAALSNSYPNAYVQCREAVCTIFWWSLLWPNRGANPRAIIWGADTLTAKPTRRSVFYRTAVFNQSGSVYNFDQSIMHAQYSF